MRGGRVQLTKNCNNVWSSLRQTAQYGDGWTHHHPKTRFTRPSLSVRVLVCTIIKKTRTWCVLGRRPNEKRLAVALPSLSCLRAKIWLKAHFVVCYFFCSWPSMCVCQSKNGTYSLHDTFFTFRLSLATTESAAGRSVSVYLVGGTVKAAFSQQADLAKKGDKGAAWALNVYFCIWKWGRGEPPLPLLLLLCCCCWRLDLVLSPLTYFLLIGKGSNLLDHKISGFRWGWWNGCYVKYYYSAPHFPWQHWFELDSALIPAYFYSHFQTE